MRWCLDACCSSRCSAILIASSAAADIVAVVATWSHPPTLQRPHMG